MAKKNSLPIYLAAFLLFAGGLGYLVVSGLTQNSVYFLNVSEALVMEPGKLTACRLFGTVEEEGLARMDDREGVRFKLADAEGQGHIWVEYAGAVPDTFKPGVEVIVEGGVEGGVGQPAAHPEMTFSAATLMTKCPSKYEKENRET